MLKNNNLFQPYVKIATKEEWQKKSFKCAGYLMFDGTTNVSIEALDKHLEDPKFTKLLEGFVLSELVDKDKLFQHIDNELPSLFSEYNAITLEEKYKILFQLLKENTLLLNLEIFKGALIRDGFKIAFSKKESELQKEIIELKKKLEKY